MAERIGRPGHDTIWHGNVLAMPCQPIGPGPFGQSIEIYVLPDFRGRNLTTGGVGVGVTQVRPASRPRNLFEPPSMESAVKNYLTYLILFSLSSKYAAKC